MKNTLLISLVIYLGFSVSNVYAQDFTIDVDPGKVKTHDIDELISSVKYLRLKMPEDQYIAGIRKILIKDNIFLLDVSRSGVCKVFCFDQDGNYKYVLYKQGVGPGEYEHIQDISITEMHLILSVSHKGLMFYDIANGSYLKTESTPDETSSQLITTPNDNIVITPAGRYQRNLSKKQLKIYNISKKKIVFEGIPFKDAALKLGHSQRPIFYYNDKISYLPMYGQTVYRINSNADTYSIKKAYSFDFGKYWIPEEILKESYNDREMFFGDKPRKFVNTVEVFETSRIIYLSYSYKGILQRTIYDKKSKKKLSISEFTNNSVGWIGKPVTTYNDYIINIVSPIEIKTSGINPSPALKKVIDETDEEGRPILVFMKFKVE